MRRTYINTLNELKEALYYEEARNFVFHKLDFLAVEDRALSIRFKECIFVACYLPDKVKDHVDEDNLIIPNLKVPYRIPNRLYSSSNLYRGYKPGSPETFDTCFDQRVYNHYLKKGKEVTSATELKDSFGRVLHDYAVSSLLNDFLKDYDPKKVVGVMGGHGISRTAESYRNVLKISKILTEYGYLMISGGGPGAMEATHLGAWMAGRNDEEVEEALSIVALAPTFRDNNWLDAAFRVMEKFPQTTYKSLGIPTWLYGHEPATPFATHIAKYFDNSIRENGILTISKGGIIYTPGSAGTMQEIFQDAAQNHYLSAGFSSPMVFLGRDYWTKEIPIYPLLEFLMGNGRYKNLILDLVDSVDEVVESIKSFDE